MATAADVRKFSLTLDGVGEAHEASRPTGRPKRPAKAKAARR